MANRQISLSFEVQHFHESAIDFFFPSSWAVRKYDDHRFYQGLSGYGLKAVDFVMLLPDGRLCLMEVKNYFPRTDERGKVHLVARKKAKSLAESLAKKYADSSRAIGIIQRYYQSKWYYRWRYALGQYLPFGYRADVLFWGEAARRMRGDLPVLILLWLETPSQAKRYRTKLYAHLAGTVNPAEVQLLLGGNNFVPLPGMQADNRLRST